MNENVLIIFLMALSLCEFEEILLSHLKCGWLAGLNKHGVALHMNHFFWKREKWWLRWHPL